MHLEKLQLLNYKSHAEVNLSFPARINVIVGRNGSGKTNLLDSIYYLAFTKSAFSSSDLHIIRQQEPYFMAKGFFRQGDRVHELVSSVQSSASGRGAGKKTFREDQQDYGKLSEHIGKYPVVLIAPDDVDLVKESSEARRKFFDGIISQLDRGYLDSLLRYNHTLKQRNSLLKMFQDSGKPDWLALEVYDREIVRFGELIYQRRLAFVQEFLPEFRRFYKFIVEEREATDLTYMSALRDIGYEEGLRKSRSKDLVLQRTSFGIHRDDFHFTLGDGDLKRLGSQGQQKSFVIALKLAQTAILERAKGFKPILLLDDIFDKLDDFRISRLLEVIRNGAPGQIFITDARPDRTTTLLETTGLAASLFEVSEQGIRASVSARSEDKSV